MLAFYRKLSCLILSVLYYFLKVCKIVFYDCFKFAK